MIHRLAVIGDPVGHSLSPQIHMTWIDAQKRKASYESIRVPKGDTASALEDFSRKKFRGLNVTLPHKQAVLESVSERSHAVAAIGAANTLTRMTDGAWRADNTDAPGLMAALARVGMETVLGKTVLVLGAGGAARAILYALDQAGAELIVLNRTVEKAGSVLKAVCLRDHRYGPLEDIHLHAEKVHFVINTTSAGHTGEHLFLPHGSGRLFFEISYGPPAEAQLLHARMQGWKTEDGLGMLVCQAAESYRIWFDCAPPDVDMALEACRETLRLHG